MLLRAVFAILFAAICRVDAQEALSDALPAPADATQQPIPESAWLDLRQNAPQNSKTQNAPVWVEALTLLPTETTEVAPMSKSVFRIRVRQPSPDYQVPLFCRSFDAHPVTALFSFEIADPRIDAPPEIYLNGQDIGPASLTLPDLGDPAYRGEVQPLSTQMHFNYTGWLRAQKIVPAASLKAGTNDLVVVNGADTGASAVRATQIQ